MNTKFYLFFIIFSFHLAFAQTTPAEQEISDKLKKISKNPNLDLDSKKKETLLLQLKAQSEKLDYKLGILISGNYLMILYLNQGRNNDAVKLGDQLKTVAKNEKDTYGYISNIYNKNSIALGNLGLADASLKDLREVLKHAPDIENKDNRFYVLSKFYHVMGLQYGLKRFENKNLRDSIVYTYNKSIDMAKQISDTSRSITKNLKYDYIGFNYMRLGMFYLEESDVKGSLELAEKYLLQGLAIYEDKRYTLPLSNKTTMLNQMSWLYMEKKEYQKSIDFAKRALELEKKFREPGNRVESYEFLATSYLELGEKEKSKFYMTNYSFLKDSIADVGRTDANKTINKITKDVEVKYEEKSAQQFIIIGAFILAAASLTFILWRRNNKKLRKNYDLMIDKLRKESLLHKTEVNPINKNLISSETEKRILDQLEIFENSEEFLRSDLTIGLLSSQLNTNIRYLAEIIKVQKSHSFSSYINHLKINYIVHKLYNEPKYRNYKTSHLAEICGYGSPQVFFVAFKKIIKVTPAYFINKLNEEEK